MPQTINNFEDAKSTFQTLCALPPNEAYEVGERYKQTEFYKKIYAELQEKPEIEEEPNKVPMYDVLAHALVADLHNMRWLTLYRAATEALDTTTQVSEIAALNNMCYIANIIKPNGSFWQKEQFLRYIKAEGVVNLQGACYIQGDLANINLSHVNLSDSIFRNAYLINAKFTGAWLKRAQLSNAYLTGADLSHADLSGADLHGSDLSFVDLSNANLEGANLENVILKNADLKNANLKDAIFFRTLATHEVEAKLTAFYAGTRSKVVTSSSIPQPKNCLYYLRNHLARNLANIALTFQDKTQGLAFLEEVKSFHKIFPAPQTPAFFRIKHDYAEIFAQAEKELSARQAADITPSHQFN